MLHLNLEGFRSVYQHVVALSVQDGLRLSCVVARARAASVYRVDGLDLDAWTVGRAGSTIRGREKGGTTSRSSKSGYLSWRENVLVYPTLFTLLAIQIALNVV